MATQKNNTFETTEGVTVRVRPLSETLINMAVARIEERHRAGGKPLDPPKYSVKLAGGGEELLDHDATTLEARDPESREINEAQTRANREAWAAYLAARAALETEQAALKKRLMYEESLDFDMPADDAWVVRQERRYGVTVPTDPDDRRWWYIETELLKSVDDILTATEMITEATYRGMVSREQVAAQRKSLQRDISRALDRLYQDEERPVGVLDTPGDGSPGEVLGAPA